MTKHVKASLEAAASATSTSEEGLKQAQATKRILMSRNPVLNLLQNNHRLKNPLSSSQLHCVLQLASWSNFNGETQVPVDDLAKRMCITKRRARGLMKELEDLDYLRRKRRQNSAELNTITLEGLNRKLHELLESDEERNVWSLRDQDGV